MAFTTRLSLLSKIGRKDEIGWYDFYRTYRPLILLRGGDRMLTDTEKEDLVQEVLLTIFRNGKFSYDPSKGKFRSFMRTVIDRRAVDILRKRKNAVINTDQDLLESLPDTENDKLETEWEQEWHKHILTQSIAELRSRLEPVTFQAFELYVIKEWKPAKVAEFLEMTVNSVYVAKNRAVELLRKIVKEQEEF